MSNNILLYTDQHAINTEINSTQQAINYFKPFYDRYKELNLAEMDTKDFPEFIENPKSFFVKILSEGKTLKIGKLELDSSKVYDLFPLPTGVSELVEDIQRSMNNNIPNFYRYVIQYVSISANGLVINPDYATQIADKNKFYTESENQVRALEIATRIAKDLTDLRALQKKGFLNQRGWVHELFKEKDENGVKRFEIELKKIRNY